MIYFLSFSEAPRGYPKSHWSFLLFSPSLGIPARHARSWQTKSTANPPRSGGTVPRDKGATIFVLEVDNYKRANCLKNLIGCRRFLELELF